MPTDERSLFGWALMLHECLYILVILCYISCIRCSACQACSLYPAVLVYSWYINVHSSHCMCAHSSCRSLIVLCMRNGMDSSGSGTVVI